MSEPSVSIGKKVPDFSAETTQGNFYLPDYQGKILVIYFYPRDNTPGCTQQAIGFRDDYAAFQQAGAAIVGVSRDSMKSHDNFTEKFQLPFPLIADTDESVCRLFDVLKSKKLYGKLVTGIERSTFIINGDGILVREWRGLKVENHVTEVLEAVRALAD